MRLCVGYAQERQNFVDVVMNAAGVAMNNTTCFNTNPGSIAAHADQALGNAAKIAEIAGKVAEQSNDTPAANDPQMGNSSTLMRTAMTAGALAVGATFAPAIAAGAAAVMAVGEAMHFGLKGNAGMGEMTIARADAAEAFEKGVYISACDSTACDVATGKQVAKAPMGQAQAPAKGMKNLDAIIAEASVGVDPDKIKGDIMAKFREQQQMFALDMRRLETMGAIDPNDPNALEAKQKMSDLGDGVKLAVKPPLKAFNVGMGAPSGPSFG